MENIKFELTPIQFGKLTAILHHSIDWLPTEQLKKMAANIYLEINDQNNILTDSEKFQVQLKILNSNEGGKLNVY